MKNYIKFSIKLLISLFLLFLIFNKIDYKDFIENIKVVSFVVLIVTVLFAGIKAVIEPLRWKIILNARTEKFSFFYLFSLYMIGGFFNIFLPTTIGGDVVRIFYIKNDKFSALKATNTVLFERLTGAYAVFIMSIIAVLVGWNLFVYEVKIPILAVSIISVVVLTSIFFSYKKITKITRQISSKYKISIIKKIYLLIREFDYTEYSYRLIFISMFFSFLIQFIVIGVTIMIGNALGLNNISIFHYFIIIPPIWVITLLPISIGGFGVREGLFALFLVPMGVSIEQSTLLSLLSFFPFIFVGLLGGLFYLFGTYSYKEAQNVKKQKPRFSC